MSIPPRNLPGDYNQKIALRLNSDFFFQMQCEKSILVKVKELCPQDDFRLDQH